MRPLGYVNANSRLEIQVEKSMFRSNLKLLSDMIMMQRTAKQTASLYPVTSYGVPQVRQVMSFRDKDRFVNNAEHVKYYNFVSHRVGGEDTPRKGSGRFGGKSVSMCSRRYDMSENRGRMKSAHCDVLGPDFCTDCTQLNKRVKSAKHNKRHFPGIDVHSNSLVAPRRLESLLLSDQNTLVNERNNSLSTVYYDLANIYSGTTKPVAYSEHEIYERVPKRKETRK